jgi:hypothetical protein
MTEKNRYQIAVDARLCGARNGMVIVLDDGSRWRLRGLTIEPVAV